MKWNWHKGRKLNINEWNIGIIFLAAVLLLCSIFMIRTGEGTEPDNPLDNQVEAAVEQELEEEKQMMEDPEESEDLQESQEPEVSEDPEESQEPEVSQEPQESQEPKESEKPEVSQEPQEPEISEDPQVSREPQSSKAPQSSEKPQESEEPQPSISPAESGQPQQSDAPVITTVPGDNGNENEGNEGEGGNDGDGITPGGDADKVYFTTSIEDGEVVEHTHYEFTIEHLYEDLQVEEEWIYVNDGLWPQFNGSVLLEKGENQIRIVVKYVDEDNKVITVYRDYTVIVCIDDAIASVKPVVTEEPSAAPIESKEPVEDIVIITNLTNQTVYQEELSFQAAWTGGTSNADMQVYMNGAPLKGEDTYHVKLNIGNNTFHIKVYDVIDGENVTKEKTVQVKYVPIATENTAPEIEYINVTDGMETVGDKFVLDIQAKDYLGNRIYADGIEVKLNGIKYRYKWANDYISYDLKLQNGENILQVRITDKDGRFTDYQYSIKCTAVADGEPIGTAIISLDADVLGLGTLLEPAEVTIYQGEQLPYMICRVLEEYGFECTYTGSLDGSDGSFYLVRVSMEGMAVAVQIPSELEDAINDEGLEWKEQRFDDSLGQFDYCQGSGWLYSVNGHFPNYSASECFLKDGDHVRIRFTLAYGKDIGGHESGESYDIPWLK